MKIKRLIRTGALIAVGVFLGRGAHADTTLTFDCTPVSGKGTILTDCIPPQINNPNSPPGITNYGNFAAASSPGIAVSGFGTPNIGLTWGSDNFPTTRWEYYNTSGTVWGDGGSGVVQLQDSFVGSTEELTFVPNNPSASVVVKSFNFDAYYNSSERFTYKVSVVSGTNVLSGPTTVSFLSDGTKNHPVNINYTGAPGQTLKLKLLRVASTLGAGEIEGNEYNNAVDDIAFAQTPATTFPAGPQVVSVTPADGTTGLPANSSPPYAATIADGPTLAATAPIQLRLDYTPVSPPPTITPLGGGQTSVSYPGAASLLANGAHVYTLTYADNLGAIYTNEVVFSTFYTSLPSAYALPPGSGVTRGFTYRTVSASTQVETNLPSTIARAVAQLNGTLINTSTSLAYTNEATLGTNADGSFNIDTVLNFTDSGSAVDNFPDDLPFPGLDFPPDNWFSTEALLYLDLPAGYYRFGVNSDDGFEVNALPPQGVSGSPIVLGLFDNGRGAADTLFDFQVPTSGVYPFQVIYFQADGFGSCEFFSVTNLATGGKVLINDPADPNAIKSYRALALAPRITSVVRNGPNVVISWANGNPPFQVQFKNDPANPVWNNIGLPTANRTANVPILPGVGFIRVFGQ
jgi:hypothetical protein